MNRSRWNAPPVSETTAPDATAPPAKPVSTAPVRFCNYEPQSADELRDACDIWLNDVCAAAWGSREMHRVAGFLITCVHTGRETELYSRDLESAINIQPEETNRSMKLLKLFGGIEDFSSDRGKLSVQVRLSLAQRLSLLEKRARLAELTHQQSQAMLAGSIAALRAISNGDASAVATARDDAHLPPPLRAIG